jgi:glutathione peroxidase
MNTYALASIVALLGCTAISSAHTPTHGARSIYDFRMKDIDGHQVRLSKYRGKVLLVVNVASHCGFTPQYKALEEVYNKYKDQGFVILGFPANNFGGQEPGSDVEIKQFCTATYNVSFPMFSKISVKGEDKHPLYQWLISSSDRPKDDIEWNFTKFIVDKKGQVIYRFKSKDTPDSPEVTAAIESALKG